MNVQIYAETFPSHPLVYFVSEILHFFHEEKNQVQSSQACVMGHKWNCMILISVLYFNARGSARLLQSRPIFYVGCNSPSTYTRTYHIMTMFTRPALSDNHSILSSLFDILLELVRRQSYNRYTLSCFWYHNYDRRIYTALKLARSGIAGYEYRKVLQDSIPCVILCLCYFS